MILNTHISQPCFTDTASSLLLETPWIFLGSVLLALKNLIRDVFRFIQAMVSGAFIACNV